MNYSIDEKYAMLDKIENDVNTSTEFTEEERMILRAFSSDEDDGIRSEVAKILVNFTDEKEEKILLKLAGDTDELVRIEACDSLSQSVRNETIEFLMDVIENDSSDLVRGYAVNSIGDISLKLSDSSEIIKYLKNYLEHEKEIFPQINALKCLYSLGIKKYFFNLIELLDTDIYQNRCAVIHNLVEIANEDNRESIVFALNKRKAIEQSRAVITTINSALEEVNL